MHQKANEFANVWRGVPLHFPLSEYASILVWHLRGAPKQKPFSKTLVRPNVMLYPVWHQQQRSSGATDNASDYGSEDCRFESCLDRQSLFGPIKQYIFLFHVRPFDRKTLSFVHLNFLPTKNAWNEGRIKLTSGRFRWCSSWSRRFRR